VFSSTNFVSVSGGSFVKHGYFLEKCLSNCDGNLKNKNNKVNKNTLNANKNYKHSLKKNLSYLNEYYIDASEKKANGVLLD
jgi:hypothetical protein